MDLTVGWTGVLRLEGVEVVAARRAEDVKGWRLTVIPASLAGLCPVCKQPTGVRHTAREQVIDDMPIAGQPLLLHLQVPQFFCERCKQFFTVHPSCVLEGAHVTMRLAEAIADCVNVSTLSAAAATYHLAETTVKGIFEKVVQQRLQKKAQTLKPIAKMGIDEIHLEVHDDPPGPGERAADGLISPMPSSSVPRGEKGARA